MANRETYPATLFPLRGDLSAEAGDTAVTVIGIQTTPVSSTLPTDFQILRYIADNLQAEWSDDSGSRILVESYPMSDDYEIFVEGGDLNILVEAAFPPDGDPILVEGA